MSRSTILVGLLVSLAMSSCKLDKICPAYQSYFLLDEKTQTNTFAYLAEDNLPRHDLPNAEKDVNGLIKSEWYVVKNYNMRTIPKQVVYPQLDDSLAFLGEEMMYAETDIVDSVALDSARTAALGFRYNNDQKFYNWYFKEKLVWADEQYPQEGETSATAITEEAVKKPFFKRLFKSKEEKAQIKAEKQAQKEAQANAPDISDSDQEKVKEPKAKKVKKVKTKKPKKNKKKGDQPPDSEDKTEEEEDDGFRTGS